MTKANDLASLLDANGDVVSSALDNVPASDLVNDTTPQLGGDLTTSGNDITFADNDKAIFGAGSDLQIYHDGFNSYIIDNGTGDLVINTNGNAISLNTNGGGEYGLRVINNGAVNLYHDNALKLATTATGVDVTGTLAATTVDLGAWTVTESGGVLYFAASGTNKAKLDASGNFTCVGDVTAFGTV